MLEAVRNFNADFDALFDESVKSTKDEVRGSRAPLPTDVYYYLSQVQRIALHSLKNFGWELAFIRRPLFVAPVVVVRNPDQAKYAVLEEDGSMNLAPIVKWRH
jgi:hypothetical protein